MEDIKEEILIKKGKMKKDPFTMTEQEKIMWKKELGERIRIHFFSIGQPLVYEKGGRMIAEFADGSIKEI